MTLHIGEAAQVAERTVIQCPYCKDRGIPNYMAKHYCIGSLKATVDQLQKTVDMMQRFLDPS